MGNVAEEIQPLMGRRSRATDGAEAGDQRDGTADARQGQWEESSDMLSFCDSDKNPFVATTQQMASPEQGEGGCGVPWASNYMRLVHEAASLQMRLAASMLSMQVGMARSVAQVAFPGMWQQQPQQPHESFKLGGFEVPPELLATVMQLDMSPEHLEKLQKTLDTVLPLMMQARPNEQ